MHPVFVSSEPCKHCRMEKMETVERRLKNMILLNRLNYATNENLSDIDIHRKVLYFKDMLFNNPYVSTFLSSLHYYMDHLCDQLKINNAVSYDFKSIMASIVNEHMCIIKVHKNCNHSNTKLGFENKTDTYKYEVYKCVHMVYIRGLTEKDRNTTKNKHLIYFDLESVPIGMRYVDVIISISEMTLNALRRDTRNSSVTIMISKPEGKDDNPEEENVEVRLQNLINNKNIEKNIITSDIMYNHISVPEGTHIQPYPCLNNSNDAVVMYNQFIIWLREAYCFPQGTKSNVREHAEKTANKRNFEVIPVYIHTFLNLILGVSLQEVLSFSTLMQKIKIAELDKEQYSLDGDIKHDYKYTINDETFPASIEVSPPVEKDNIV